MNGGTPNLDALAEERAPQAVCLADVEPEEVEFLWRPYLPLGKLTLLEGDPGQGKSYLTTSLAAILSRGGPLPTGESLSAAGTTLLLSAEDGLADTIRPRLDALGADVRHVYAYPQPVDLSREEGRATLAALIGSREPLLVVVDPLVAYVGFGTDTHRANQVRGILAPLAAMAGEHGCAVLAVRHLSKARAARAIHAGNGSVDFAAAARSILLAGSCSEQPEERAMVHVKTNLAKLGPAFGYRIDDGKGFQWTGRSTLTGADLLRGEDGADPPSARQEAAEFITQLLEDGPVAASQVKQEAEAVGVSMATLKRAKRAAGVVSRRMGRGHWVWELQAR